MEKQKQTMAIVAIVLSILGLLTVCLGVGVLFSLISLILGIVVLVKKKKGGPLATVSIIISCLSIVLFLIILVFIQSVENISTSKTSSTALSSLDQPATVMSERTEEEREETTSLEETTLTEETTSQESEEEFKSSCQAISYKSLLRTPDEYIGQRIEITGKIQQIMNGGWFDDSKYYRVQTDNDGYEWYLDDEYYMYDGRPDGSVKILKDDVIKIYAEFIGIEEVHRAITGTTDEVPAIRAYYIELISE